MGEGNRVSQAREAGRAALRLCSLLHKARQIPKEDLQEEVERELTGRETELERLSISSVLAIARGGRRSWRQRSK